MSKQTEILEQLATRAEILEASEADSRRAVSRAQSRTIAAQQAETNARARLLDVLREVEANEAQRAVIEQQIKTDNRAGHIFSRVLSYEAQDAFLVAARVS